MAKEKVVLAYSGGLDTSVAIKWLQETYNYDVIAVALDVGEGKDLEFVRDKALQVGAIKSYVVDAKELFANEFVLPALKANAMYEGKYPVVSALSRPLIAKVLVDIAEEEGAVAVAHGCTGKGNDQVRFDVSITALNPNLKIVAPVREWGMSRDEEIKYAMKHNIPIPVDLDNPYSIDQNLWGRACECGELENPWNEPPKGAYDLTAHLEDTPDAPEEIEIEFIQGKPVALNGKEMPLSELILELNKIAGKHGVGRIDHVENRLVGIKSREVYEAPGAITLILAHRELEFLTQPREVAQFKPIIEQKISQVIYEGLWFSPIMDALKAFVEETQKFVTGTIRVKLFKGHAIVVGRKSASSLYDENLATYGTEDTFDHQAAIGFVKLWGLPTKVFVQTNKDKLDHAPKAVVIDKKEAIKQ
ncbi:MULTISPECIES: argininosuccinate synthase [Aneurinibacillus]|uniref:Argininosuccinate synthase n=1 Tax=Aneurinibacillus thermoaerophilus TaxID=143495 RepID=A0A1G8EB18_ANETH|nr:MULTISPECIES: argininosuccinate synthase [Aneurinibacillus]AMA71764.1 argininosuccinate synthase [Aneurinibacillus sp. XH2]MED0680754.1 argininosuccinate synthase [Aneurinibacillus thermoaerophilus]MED0738777.1 argininosuccinate synthase [Aneurinibacillus thermoaerophilus]MED0758004.1 argininosuccinate synthase [Aneurinibacillus thermoaerophilus]MED0762355.1 argininosuccinate synthase [Aneurinibacillus thermoaerophilus]